MVGLLKREAKVEPFEFGYGWFDHVFDDWPRLFPRMLTAKGMPEGTIPVDTYEENGSLVVRAELPGLDPAKDVELTISDGMLHIKAQRREEEKTEAKGYMRRELRYGAFTRTLPLPEGAAAADITAGYRDGILEIRAPLPKVEPAMKIPVTTS